MAQDGLQLRQGGALLDRHHREGVPQGARSEPLQLGDDFGDLAGVLADGVGGDGGALVAGEQPFSGLVLFGVVEEQPLRLAHQGHDALLAARSGELQRLVVLSRHVGGLERADLPDTEPGHREQGEDRLGGLLLHKLFH